jgi:hypothetical protein
LVSLSIDAWGWVNMEPLYEGNSVQSRSTSTDERKQFNALATDFSLYDCINEDRKASTPLNISIELTRESGQHMHYTNDSQYTPKYVVFCYDLNIGARI